MSMPTLTLNLEKEDTLDNQFLVPTIKNILVSANAGTGKSYLIEAYLQHLLRNSPDKKCLKVLVCVFNNANEAQLNVFIVKEMAQRRKRTGNRTEKLPIKASTFHKLGDGLLKGGNRKLKYNPTIDNRELIEFNEEKEVFSIVDRSLAIGAYQTIKGAYGNLFINGKVSEEKVLEELTRQGYNFKKTELEDAAKFFAELLKKSVKNKEYKSASDMLMLSKSEYSAANPTIYDVVIVDECQDSNPTQVGLFLSHCDENTKLILVGDEKQAINTFQGAMPWDELISGIEAVRGIFARKELLTTFRNSEAIVGFTNAYFSEFWNINAKTERGGGLVSFDTPIEQILELATSNPKDLAIMAYSNKDVIGQMGLCLACGIEPIYTGIKKSERADIYRAVIKIISSFDGDLEGLKECVDKTLAGLRFNSRLSPSQIVEQSPYIINTMVLGFLNAFEQIGEKSLKAIAKAIANMDKLERKATLTTIHKSKGMTFTNTLLVNMVSIGKYAITNSIADARCLAYVGLTRAKEGLYITGSKATTFEGLVNEGQAAIEAEAKANAEEK